MGTATAGKNSQTAWHNWAGNVSARPTRVVNPASVGELQEAVRRAAGPPGDAKTLVALGLYGLMRAGSWAPDQADRPPPDAPARRAAKRP